MTPVARPATASEVAAICGHLDDEVIAAIVATGATAAEVLEAFTSHSAGDRIATEIQHSSKGAVGAVYKILVRAPPGPARRG